MELENAAWEKWKFKSIGEKLSVLQKSVPGVRVTEPPTWKKNTVFHFKPK
jgi:hypothetical protein